MTSRNLKTLAMAGALLCAAQAAHAEIDLIGMGTLKGGADLSGLTGTLENGVPANRLDGTGSGLAYAGGNVFLVIPDRGPNAKPYNDAVDNTTSYISRFHTVTMAVTPFAGPLPLQVKPTLTGTTLLFSATPLAYGSGEAAHLPSGAPPQNMAGRYYFSGRSDDFAPGGASLATTNGRFDPEGVRVAADGRSVFVSDEYGPSVYRFDRKTGARIASFALPAKFAVTALSPVGDTEIAQAATGRTANKGMEGLAITPDGKMLLGSMQAALRQDAAVAASKKLVRLVAIDIASGATHEYGYLLTDGSGVSEILAINDHEFLLLERDGDGLGEKGDAVAKKLYRIDISGAADIGALDGAAAAAAAVPKREVLDMVKVLGANGVAPAQVPSKLEGIAFGPDVTVGGRKLHTLYMMNDNDFRPDLAGENLIYLYGFTDADIPGLVPQALAK